jgi:type I restriction enzyme, S subunit
VTDTELELPKGWVETTIGSIAKMVHYGYTATSTKEDTGTKYLRITDIQNNHVNWNDVPFCKIPKERRNNYLLNENDIVFARTGGTVGKSFLIKQDVPSVVFASYLIRVVLTEQTDPHFIHYFFQSGDYWQQIQLGKTGLKTNVNAQILSKLTFLLPPLNEQKRIVTKIEELFSKIDSAKQSLEQTKVQLEQYRASLLKSAFEGKILHKNKGSKNLMRIETIPLGQLVEEIIDHRGVTPKKLGGDWVKEGMPVLSAKNIKNFRLVNKEKIRFITKKMGKRWMPRDVQFGDLLITSEGATLGELALLKEHTRFCLGQRLFGVRTNNKILDSTFLYYFLISSQGQQEIFKHATGTTATGLRQTELLKLSIRLPEIKNQKQIVSLIEQGFSLIENTSQIVESSLQKLQIMKMSVLKQAFEGKLVPQDSNDEPASVLLERIKAK